MGARGVHALRAYGCARCVAGTCIMCLGMRARCCVVRMRACLRAQHVHHIDGQAARQQRNKRQGGVN
eukprot:788583-Alexandrium_andersonii.AAC.1